MERPTADERSQSPLPGECDVIIVNYNAGGLLAACVDSAFAAGACRVIVVDNGSHDDSLMTLESSRASGNALQILRNTANLGFAVACNQGARLSTAPNLLFLNPDAVLAVDAMGRLLLALHRSPEIGVVGGFLCNPDGTEQAGGRRVFPTPKRAFMRAFGLSRFTRFFPAVFADFLLHKEPLPTAPIVVEAISGACMLVKREAIENVGLWDEDYFLHCEDLDWCMRFRQAGWSILFVPDARITHVFGGCSRDRPYFVEWHKHRGILHFYRKFFRQRYSVFLWIVVVIGVWFRFSLMVLRHAVIRLSNTLTLRKET
ncbi:glycosyltransferase family 2 protein [Pseudomonas gingeri]|uniref:Glycosyltransferase family 2 protein n=1 Tax=Pseudomonas gingeri TaxID=117681 RepID=A0A7Y7YFY3_9PSED|nr:glycosyltransferase family 2 protein [Pseudomonas gingeri]NWA02622.1 glycosyltransferase family 2 protein [Pseudomonas gingeri]NWA12205.1 glycosyltransferase family 2 protein [Pseudomonas gingeri]NWA57389.1 glycosyltransferase family 2 protein [Pseudomonas gingeri]NWA93732.1 glycosyltransferase family 2 protein [Pseudomonas gingeri]NWB03204.1 glycosyltransferase family 2 protein [Pseudomonas gingeri]